MVGGKASQSQETDVSGASAAAFPSRVRLRGPTREDVLSALAAGTVAGDRGCEGELLRQLTLPIQRLLRRMCDLPEADDALQEGLLAVRHALPAFRGDGTVTHFALGVVLKCTLAQRRHLKRRARQEASVAQSEVVLVDAPATPQEDALARRRRTALRDLLEFLPGVQAETLALRALGDYSLQQVAEVTGAPLNTVRTRLRLARKALKQRIESDPSLRELFGI